MTSTHAVGPRRRPARSGRRPPPARGRGARARPPGGRRAVRLHARRRAPLRDAADAHRRDTSRTTRGDEVTNVEISLRHPGRRQGHDQPGGPRGRWRLRDLDLRRRPRPDLRGAHKLGTQRPIRNRPRGLDDRGLPGLRQGLRAGDAARRWRPCRTRSSIPAGFCQNVLATGRCTITGTEPWRSGARRSSLDCDHPRTIEIAGDRPDYRLDLAVDRDDRRHPAARRDDRRRRHPRRRGHRPRPRCAAAAVGLRVRLPDRDDDALLSPEASEALGEARIVPARVEPRRDPRRGATIPGPTRWKGGPATDPAIGAAVPRGRPGRRRPRVILRSPRLACGAPTRPLPPLPATGPGGRSGDRLARSASRLE